jgi:hypothetical protein
MSFCEQPRVGTNAGRVGWRHSPPSAAGFRPDRSRSSQVINWLWQHCDLPLALEARTQTSTAPTNLERTRGSRWRCCRRSHRAVGARLEPGWGNLPCWHRPASGGSPSRAIRLPGGRGLREVLDDDEVDRAGAQLQRLYEDRFSERTSRRLLEDAHSTARGGVA